MSDNPRGDDATLVWRMLRGEDAAFDEVRLPPVGPADGTVRTSTQEAVGFVECLFPVLPAAGFLFEF